jgi:CIC family chloride channel protein
MADLSISFIQRLRLLAQRFLLVTLAVVGALCGVLAVLFEKYVERTRDLLIGRALDQDGALRIVLTIVLPAIVFAAIAAVIGRFAPRAVGANLARVRMAYNADPELLRPRSVAATFTATPLSLGAGAPLGPEGPIVVVTSGFSSGLARLLGFPPKLVRGMIPVGVAAGIAAIFNAPITGVVFALEEVVGTADRGLLGGVLVGSVAAAVVERMLLGGRPLLAAPFSTWHDPREFIGFAAVGIIAGLVSGTAIAAAHRLKRSWARAMPSIVMRAALAGLLIGAAGIVAPSILGVGYDSVSFWLHGGGTAEGTAIAFAVKTLAYVLAISGGILGGSFAPSLFIGTALGASIGHVSQMLFGSAPIDPKAYAILGMGAFFAGLLRSPIAAVLIVIELTRDYDLVLPLMLGVSLAVAISRRISPLSIVEQQMIDEGYVESREESDPLGHVRTGEAMTPTPLAIVDSALLRDAAREMLGRPHRFYPVVDRDGRLVGVVSRAVLDAALAGNDDGRQVVDVVEEPKLVATAGESVTDVVERMKLKGVDRCPVIDDETSRRVVGFLSPSDLLRIRMQRLRRADDPDFEIFEMHG